MAQVHVHSEGINASAGRLAKTNDSIRDSFEDLKKSIGQLDSSWDGCASEYAIRKFFEIDKEFSKKRYDAFASYVDHLRAVVNPGYAETESKNVSLADSFK